MEEILKYLPLLLYILSEVIGMNPKLQSNSVIGFIYNGLKALPQLLSIFKKKDDSEDS